METTVFRIKIESIRFIENHVQNLTITQKFDVPTINKIVNDKLAKVSLAADDSRYSYGEDGYLYVEGTAHKIDEGLIR